LPNKDNNLISRRIMMSL